VVQKSQLAGFATNWNKRVAWAQSQGINKNSYYPIYQMDSARLLAGESPMSNAEATRAILAASNPNNVTPVPGDKPNPTNILGNTVSDLRNIFTGLAPNHLVTNIYDTVKSAITKPSTWITPLADIAQGNIKQGLEAAAGLNGQNSILSWLPGVYVAGEIAQGGVGEALSHPVVGFLDVAPFASAGRVIEAGADASRVASMADRVGMTTSQFRDASLPGMAKGWVLSTKLADTPFADRFASTGQLHELSQDGTPKPTTIGDALDRWITTHTGMGKTLSGLMKGMLNLNDEHTQYEQAVIGPAAEAMRNLKPDEQQMVSQLVDRSNPATKGKSVPQIMFDDSIPENVRTAYGAVEKARQWVSDQALASGQTVAFTRLDGSTGFSHTAGQTTTVLDASKELRDAQDTLVAAMDPANKITESMRQWDTMATRVMPKFGQDWQKASERAQYLQGTYRAKVGESTSFRGRVSPEYVPIDIGKQARWLFGPVDPITGEGGIMDSITKAVNEKDYGQVKELTRVALSSLSGHGVHAIDATIDPAFVEVRQDITALHRYAIKRIDAATKFYDRLHGYARSKGGPGYDGIRPQLRRFLKARRDFGNAVWKNPTGDWVDVVQQLFIENLIKEGRKFGRMEEMSKELRDRGFAKEKIDQLQRDPTKMAQLLQNEVNRMAGAPLGVAIMTKDEMEAIYRSAVDQANKMREQGFEVRWVPHVSSTMLKGRDTDTGLYGIHLQSKGLARRIRAAHEKKLGDQPTRYDVLASIHLAAKEALQRDATIEYADSVLSPHLISREEAETSLMKMPEFHDELVRYDPASENYANVAARIMSENFNMVPFDPQSTFGWTLPKWSNEMYMPRGISKSLDTMLQKGQFPMEGIINKPTRLFRFAILGLSPRYTAHVVFGGSFLLALHLSPRALSAIPEAWNIMKGGGDVPRETFQGAAQRGLDPVEYKKIATSQRATAGRAYMQKMGMDATRWLAEEHIEKVQGIKLSQANPVNWLKAVSDLNFKVTNFASSFQRSIAYVDHLNNSIRKGTFKDPETGEVTEMSMARARHEAEQHSLHVMGDLKAMTPLERNVLTNVFPFYGWTKHILSFVMSYPADHPFRAQMLSVMATQNSNDVASGLPKRLQFLMFLGSPDVQGNVTAVDVRALDPLRDVANYATLAGVLSSLNPVLSAPLAVVDPSIIFGGNPLYPKVTYDQFYGIETAGAQGTPLTALEQIVPQVSALDAALNLSGQYRNLAATNPNSFAKTIFSALNVPFAQVQHLNLKQIAAKTELDRYHVASQAAQNAFQTGDFSTIAPLSSVPDPQNADYEVSPKALSDLYNQLLQQYPGQAPAETAPPPPPAPI